MTCRSTLVAISAGLLLGGCVAKETPVTFERALARYAITSEQAEVNRQKELEADWYRITHAQAWTHGIDYGSAIAEAEAGDLGALAIVLWTRNVTDAGGSWFHGGDAFALTMLWGENTILRAMALLPADGQADAIESIFFGALDFFDYGVGFARQRGRYTALPADLSDLKPMLPRLWARWAPTANPELVSYFA